MSSLSKVFSIDLGHTFRQMSLGLENGAVTSQFNLMQMLKHQISEFWEAFNTMKKK